MGYRSIPNLYKDATILEFKNCYAMEKVEGSSANVTWSNQNVTLSSGGASAVTFASLFDINALKEKFISFGHEDAPIVIYGEVYGGKIQKMSQTYGPNMNFIGFEVKIGDIWLDVKNAEDVCKKLNIEFVPYEFGPTTVEWLNAQRDADSIVAIRRGMGQGKMREGIVIRPPFEVIKNNEERIVTKHKRAEFSEMATPREINFEELKVLSDAEAIANEWVTEHRLSHVLQGIEEPHNLTKTADVIRGMVADVFKESVGEIIDSPAARKAISKRASELYRRRVLTQGL